MTRDLRQAPARAAFVLLPILIHGSGSLQVPMFSYVSLEQFVARGHLLYPLGVR